MNSTCRWVRRTLDVDRFSRRAAGQPRPRRSKCQRNIANGIGPCQLQVVLKTVNSRSSESSFRRLAAVRSAHARSASNDSHVRVVPALGAATSSSRPIRHGAISTESNSLAGASGRHFVAVEVGSRFEQHGVGLKRNAASPRKRVVPSPPVPRQRKRSSSMASPHVVTIDAPARPCARKGASRGGCDRWWTRSPEGTRRTPSRRLPDRGLMGRVHLGEPSREGRPSTTPCSGGRSTRLPEEIERREAGRGMPMPSSRSVRTPRRLRLVLFTETQIPSSGVNSTRCGGGSRRLSQPHAIAAHSTTRPDGDSSSFCRRFELVRAGLDDIRPRP